MLRHFGQCAQIFWTRWFFNPPRAQVFNRFGDFDGLMRCKPTVHFHKNLHAITYDGMHGFDQFNGFEKFVSRQFQIAVAKWIEF